MHQSTLRPRAADDNCALLTRRVHSHDFSLCFFAQIRSANQRELISATDAERA